MLRTAALLKGKTVSIGNVTIPLHRAASPSFIPSSYLSPLLRSDSEVCLRQLKWMLSKDALRQDMFLLGSPGPHRRRLTFAFAEMTNRDVEVVTLSADTTESDLKQRREITKGGSSIFVDQAPVRAAVNGSLLVLDGIQFAERNVLPLLNNLLENREMNLEDGRLLVSSKRYAELKGTSRHNLVPTHESFRVVALGSPAPPFGGNTLDPPLRSRFQALRVDNPSPAAVFQELSSAEQSLLLFPESSKPVSVFIDKGLVKSLSSLSGALDLASPSSSDAASAHRNLPVFPSTTLPIAQRVLSSFPLSNPRSIIESIYPFSALPDKFLSDKQRSAKSTFSLACDKLKLGRPPSSSSSVPPPYSLVGVTRSPSDANSCSLAFRSTTGGDPAVVVPANCGPLPFSEAAPPGKRQTAATFVSSEPFNGTRTAMLQCHAAGSDILLVSEKGGGKSALAAEFAKTLGYRTVLFSLYKDMTSRDLLMRRSTDLQTGETTWSPSPLVSAALSGDVCVLDGVEKLAPDSLRTLQGLLTDRELTLPDGTRLLRKDRFDLASQVAAAATASSSSSSSTAKILSIHPSFRVVALGTIADASSKQSAKFLDDEILPCFATLYLSPPSNAALRDIVAACHPNLPPSDIDRLLVFHSVLTPEKARDCGVATLSLRNVLRVARKVSASADDQRPGAAVGQLHAAISAVVMADLLPKSQRDVLNSVLAGVGIKPAVDGKATQEKATLQVVAAPTAQQPQNNKNPELVPSPLFFDIPMHVRTINSICADLNRGEKSILLIGNQGVGKNKIADRILQLQQTEREYIQLHRDSTVGQLTLAPSLINGRVVWEDSPLVRAIVHGRTLMIDEADKAPLEVVAVLKSLVEDKEMRLADGRRIVTKEKAALEAAHNRGLSSSSSETVIPIHENFRMFVLANRPGKSNPTPPPDTTPTYMLTRPPPHTHTTTPTTQLSSLSLSLLSGYPFLGNDFFREVGDVFATHAIPNPDVESEKMLLKSYAPNTSDAIIHKLASSFSELRRMSDSGDINYPYSTREAVATVKHLEKFPEDGIVNALSNVLHFDLYDDELYRQLVGVFNRNGIPLHANSKDGASAKGLKIDIAKPVKLQQPTKAKWSKASATSNAETISVSHVPVTTRKLNLTAAITSPFFPTEHRIESFTHLVRSWDANASKSSYSTAKSLATLGCLSAADSSSNPSIHVLTTNPIAIHNFYNTTSAEASSTRSIIDIESNLPQYLPTQPPPVMCGIDDGKSDKVLVVFFPSASLLLEIEPISGRASYFTLPPVESKASKAMSSFFSGGGKGGKPGKQPSDHQKLKGASGEWTICDDLVASRGRLLLYKRGESDVAMVDLDLRRGVHNGDAKANSVRWLRLGDDVCIDKITCASPDCFYVNDVDQPTPWRVSLTSESSHGGRSSATINQVPLVKENRLDNFSFASATTSPPHLKLDKTARGILSDTSAYISTYDSGEGDPFIFVTPRPAADTEATLSQSCYHPESTYFVSARRKKDSRKDVIEVVDAAAHELREIELEEEKTPLELKRLTRDHVCLLDEEGKVSIYEVGKDSIEKELESFREMLGLPKKVVPDGEGMRSLTLSYGDGPSRDGTEGESWKPPALKDPKFGQWDDKNEAHVGGSNWAGGTGGSNTAGLGGRGGPYRLDRGHKVHQVSDAAKAEVTEESKKIAREMADKALKDKLREIDMKEEEFEMYERLVSPIRPDISNLRQVLANAEAKTLERTWLKQQSHGELDDSKLVDGVTGEKFVFKRRGVPPAEPGTAMKSPKRIRFVMDCSGSMYRFNGQDGRLDRSLEVAALIMEAFNGVEHRFDYSIVGHSGDSPVIPLVNFGQQPKTEMDRMRVLKKMVAHTQFCSSGDYTLEAISQAKKDVAHQVDDADEYVVVAISDANLRRYGISTDHLKRVVEEKPEHGHDVRTYAIFIASIGSEAEDIRRGLGAGRGYVCSNTNMLPKVMREILAKLKE